jgi:hypothetical protein
LGKVALHAEQIVGRCVSEEQAEAFETEVLAKFLATGSDDVCVGALRADFDGETDGLLVALLQEGLSAPAQHF